MDKKGKESSISYTFQNFNYPEKILYELLFRLMLPRLVNRCQGNCTEKLFPADKEVYLVSKSRKRVSFVSNHGKVDSKYCPLYIYFKAEYPKKYERHIHDIHYDVFPFM